jgi:hypothetical protein
LRPLRSLVPAGIEEGVAELAKRVAAAKEDYDAKAARLAEKRQRQKECDLEIQALVREKGALMDKVSRPSVDVSEGSLVFGVQSPCRLFCRAIWTWAVACTPMLRQAVAVPNQGDRDGE